MKIDLSHVPPPFVKAKCRFQWIAAGSAAENPVDPGRETTGSGNIFRVFDGAWGEWGSVLHRGRGGGIRCAIPLYELRGAGDFVWRPGGNIHIAHAPDGATSFRCSTGRTGFSMGRSFLRRRGKAGRA